MFPLSSYELSRLRPALTYWQSTWKYYRVTHGYDVFAEAGELCSGFLAVVVQTNPSVDPSTRNTALDGAVLALESV